MAEYHQLSDIGTVSRSSNHSVSPGVIKVLKEHGYTIEDQLGRGASGIAFLVKDADGDLYVVKQMDCRDEEELDSVKKEVEILKTLQFGYVVSYVDSFEGFFLCTLTLIWSKFKIWFLKNLIEVFTTKDIKNMKLLNTARVKLFSERMFIYLDKDAGRIYIVMEYCEGVDLSKIMEKQKDESFFEEKQVLDWLVQICLALQYLHEKNILHRDIKPQNVFLTKDGYVNLGDFGSSKALERANEYANSIVGAKPYISPEVYKKKYNFKSDIWSLGWLLHDLCMLDVWADDMQRNILHAMSMAGQLPHVSERYSEELRELIGQMLSPDPKDRPSAEEILAKPFLTDAVDRNSRIPEALLQTFIKSISAFDGAYNRHYEDLEGLVSEWGRTTDSMESAHYSATAGSLSGSVIGAAGGITALVGLILAPFTLGASLIVTGVGVGVGVAGGVTGAASTITNTVQQKAFRESLEQIQTKYESVSEPILTPLNTLRKVLRKITKFSVFFGNSTFDNVNISCNLDTRNVLCATQLLNLGLLANISRIATQTARVGRVVAEAFSGVLSGLLVILDVAFIVLDSVDIHQMRRGHVDDPEKVKSSVLKSIAEMRRTHNELCNVQTEIQKTREELKDYIELVGGDREIDNDFNCLNI